MCRLIPRIKAFPSLRPPSRGKYNWWIFSTVVNTTHTRNVVLGLIFYGPWATPFQESTHTPCFLPIGSLGFQPLTTPLPPPPHAGPQPERIESGSVGRVQKLSLLRWRQRCLKSVWVSFLFTWHQNKLYFLFPIQPNCITGRGQVLFISPWLRYGYMDPAKPAPWNGASHSGVVLNRPCCLMSSSLSVGRTKELRFKWLYSDKHSHTNPGNQLPMNGPVF